MNKFTVLFSLILTSATLLLLGGCKDNSTNPNNSQPPPAGSTTTTIALAGNVFTPASPTIAKHTTITWYNNSGVTHTSTSNTGIWDTGDIDAGNSKTTTFDSTGTFPYYCKYHPMMVGTITVQ